MKNDLTAYGYFAGIALKALMPDLGKENREFGKMTPRKLAVASFNIAEEMIFELQQRKAGYAEAGIEIDKMFKNIADNGEKAEL
jgi:hypothetical protein